MQIALVLSLVCGDPATALSVTGRVEVRTAGVTSPLERFASVPEEATVITHEDALATLRLASGSIVRLGPRTELALVRLEHGDPPAERREGFMVKVGRLWTGVLRLVGREAQFEVATPNAVAGVRGTAFFVSVEPGQTRFVVDHGAVVVTQGEHTITLDGEGAALLAGLDHLRPIERLRRDRLESLRGEVAGTGARLLAALDDALVEGTLRRGAQAAWRRELVRPEGLIDTLTSGPLAAGPAAETDLTIRLRFPAP